ncbi:RNA polymerase II mediator complex subunit [Tulasnella sp. 403]|nr:RNA polymerase II mediator complex subunit [Tulasnella sp. 403]
MSSSSSARPSTAARAATSTVQPPDWQLPWHRTADLGYPDFHPPRPGQEEDSMAEAYVKQGYNAKAIVQTESFTVHEMIHETWEKGDQAVLRQLGELISEVAVKKERSVPGVGPSTFKLPERRTQPLAKAQSWIADLANPNVPLTRLNKIVLNGPKGSDLLDMLESQRVPTHRAVWYVRMVGAADNQNMSRGRATFNPTQYSVEWANVVTGYLKKHLDAISLPRAQTGQSSSIKSTFKSVLSEPESRDKWIHKFSYTLALLREFYAEGLVDHGAFLFWLAQQVRASNIPQLGFVAKLAEEYLEGLIQHRGFLRPFVIGLIEKYVELARIPQTDRGVVAHLSLTLGSLLQKTFMATPDAFVYPFVWKDRTNQRLLHHLFVDRPHEIVLIPHEKWQARQIYDEMKANFEVVEKRNRALLMTNLPSRNSFAMKVAMADIQLLNSIGPQTDLHTITYFESTFPGDVSDDPSSSFEAKLNVLLTWSVARSQYGDHRPYATATLISLWRDEAKLRAIRRKLKRPDGPLQEQLFNWLDTSDVAKDHNNNLGGVAMLFGELCRKGLFSYAWFIQRLIARGETEGNDGEEGALRSHLLTVLAALPIPSSSFAGERRVALYGVNAASGSKEAVDRSIRREIKASLPLLFGTEKSTGWCGARPTSLPSLLSAPPFEQHYAICHWLIPIVHDRLKEDPPILNIPRLDPETYSALLEIMRLTKSYPAILDLNLRLIRETLDEGETQRVVDTFLRHADIWVSMDALGTIGEMLFATHCRLRIAQVGSGAILVALIRPEYLERLSTQSRTQVEEDVQALALASQPADPQSRTPPPINQDILDLPQAENHDAPLLLARDLWNQYGDNSSLMMIWDNAIQGVRQVASLSPDHTFRSDYVQLYSRFLQEFQRFLPLNRPLDPHIQDWFRLGNGRADFSEYDANTWKTIMLLVLDMVLRGCLSASTLLENVAYVAWKQAATLDRPLEQTEIFLTAANSLTERLLLMDLPQEGSSEEEDAERIPPFDLTQVQRFQTQRQRVYSETGFKPLFKALRHLVSLEANNHLSASVRESSTRMRVALCEHPQFRTTAFRHLADLKEVFVRPLTSEKDVRLADALRLIIHLEGSDLTDSSNSDPVSQWQSIFGQLNAWGFSRASVELRLTLERMGSGLESDDEEAKQKAGKDIHYFMTGMFVRDMDPEETDLTADVLKGIGGAVAAQFLNHGVKRLAEHLQQLGGDTMTLSTVTPFLTTSGEILRLLASVSIPSPTADEWVPEWTPPSFEEAVIEGFMKALYKTLEDVEKVVNGTYVANKVPNPSPRGSMGPAGASNTADALTTLKSSAKFVELVILLARMLQFVLRFGDVWTTKVKSVAEDLVSVLVNLTVAFGGGSVMNPTLFRMLLDTTSYVQDEIPKEPKTPNIDVVRQIPGIQPDRLPARMPLEYRHAIQPLLAYVPRDPYTQDLVHLVNPAEQGHRLPPPADGESQYQLGPPVQARPWEWIEYLEDRTSATPEESDQVKNETSVSLEYFMAKSTGEKLSKDDEWDEYRHAEDHMHRETVFERDWKETRVGPVGLDDPDSSESEEEGGRAARRGAGHAQGGGTEETRSILSNSGTSPAMTRAGSTGRRTIEREIIDVDALPGPDASSSGVRGKKRKAAAANSGLGRVGESAEQVDDDVEIIEPSAAAATRGKNRGRARPPASVRGRGKKK